jgi:hypothetical protein
MVRVRFQAQAMFWLVTAPARFLLVELGEGGRETVGTFARLVARYGTKNVPTHVEIIAELPACHAGAVTNRRLGSGTTVQPPRCGASPFAGPRENAYYWQAQAPQGEVRALYLGYSIAT